MISDSPQHNLSGKRIFISGGAGVIGTCLVEKLLNAGACLFVGDLKPSPQSWRKKLQYRRGDLATISKQELVDFSPEIFFHLAATFERTSETYPFYEENFHHNLLLSHHLMDCLRFCSSLQKVVFASSYLIYDPNLYTFSDFQALPVSLNEESSIYPRNICGGAKLFHELELRFLEHFLGKQVKLIAARIFRVYGLGSRDIISRWIRETIQGKILSVYCPEGMFDYIYADDVAEGLLRLSNTEFSGIVNLGSGQSRRVSELLNILKQQFPNLKTQLIDSPPGVGLEASQADMQRFVEITGWKPSHTLESAIPKIVKFEKAHSTTSLSETRSGVLITSISKKVPLITAVRNAAQKIGCIETIHGADSDENCIAKFSVDKFWKTPPLSLATRELVAEYCQQHQIQTIIPTRDGELSFFSEHRQWLLEKGIYVLVSDPAAITSCIDKKSFSEILQKAQIPSISTYLTLEEFEADSYVVKERFGAGSIGVGLKLSKQEAIEFARKLKDPIFQPYIEGSEYTIDLYRDQTGVVKGVIARQRNLIVNGESQITTTERNKALEEICNHAAQVLNLYGHATFQAFKTADDQYSLIECNPRFGGASTASIAAGLDSFYWFFLEAYGETLQNYPFLRIPGELRQVRYSADKISDETR